MRSLLILVLLASSCCAQVAPLPAWNSQSLNAWWDAHPTPEQWPQAVDELKGQLAGAYDKNKERCFSDPDFNGWLQHLQWVIAGLQAHTLLENPQALQTFITLGKSETVSQLFVKNLSPKDHTSEALSILIRIAQTAHADLNEFPALAVAYSLVFDQPFPRNWPHSQVEQKAVPLGDPDPVQRFNYYVQASRNKKTEFDLSKLGFEELKYLVDCPLQLSELDYGAKNHISHSRFGEAFFSIKYDEERYKSATYSWQLPSYRLQDIEKNGGICVDQAYYAAILGKARGIPTLYFHGEGSDGGHAWFGYLEHPGKWQTDCGRYASQNYPIGYAIDPQTWTTINDSQLENLVKSANLNPNYAPAKAALVWAKLNENSPLCRQIYEDARTLMPALGEIWQSEGAWLEANNAPLEDRKKFYGDWIHQFLYNRDLKVEGQKQLAALLKQSGDPEGDKLEHAILAENRSKRFDLAINAGAGALAEKLEAKDWKNAEQEYKKLVRKFEQQGGGNLFYAVVQPYVKTCIEEEQYDLAQEGLKYAEKRMPLSQDSIISREFDTLSDDIKKARAK
ncbi:MAG: hypothetical protein PHD76_07585 [Methylacidiphilales bacterium]|nr:hypothetical protein [Candidatus Methylacidiphilales bacterium]